MGIYVVNPNGQSCTVHHIGVTVSKKETEANVSVGRERSKIQFAGEERSGLNLLGSTGRLNKKIL